VRRVLGFVCALTFTVAAHAQPAVTVTLVPQDVGPEIPDDFVGLSFGMKALPGNRAGAHLFSATNHSLVAIFQNVGIRHLRVGGTTVESPPSTPIPNEADIDSLFGFARAAGVKKIIYSLRLLQTNAACHYEQTNAAIARYIWEHYQPQLQAFAIGNEPDLQRVFKQDYIIRDFDTYISQWNAFAHVITNAVPAARFVGPDAGSGNAGWSARFGAAEKAGGLVGELAMHYYAGGRGKGVSAGDGLEAMLSAEWLTNYGALHRKIAAIGNPFRFTEANDHYSGGIPDASDTFAGALWALDFLHWWAAHGARGVDFHNTQWVVSDVVTPTSDGRFKINPKGYGLKAFDLGSHGRAQAVKLSQTQPVSLTAYAVAGTDATWVTVINKEHGTNAAPVDVAILVPGAGEAKVMRLLSPHNNVAAKEDVTLGGDVIRDNAAFAGQWTPLPAEAPGRFTLKLAPASAAVVQLISSNP
jgi:hypothetical protein